MNAILNWLASFCKDNLLTEKWLLVDDLRVGQQWKDRLVLSGNSAINLHSKTLRSLSIALASDILVTRDLKFIDASASRMIVHGVVAEKLSAGELEYFGSVHSVDGIARLMNNSIRDLQLAGMSADSLQPAAFESAAKGRDVRRVFEAYCKWLDANRLADYADCVQLASRGVAEGSIELPADLAILLPEELTLAAAEQSLLDAIIQRSVIYRPPHEQSGLCLNSTFNYFAGQGEVNEVRGVMQRILSGQRDSVISFDDVQILHTDSRQYVPLLLELFSTWLCARNSGQQPREAVTQAVDTLPITFDDGIACVYSRPGRALRGWLRWAGNDYVQSKLVQLLREGLLTRPESATEIGYARLANTLRKIPIGFKLERYNHKVEEAIAIARQSQIEHQENRDREASDVGDDEPPRDFGVPTLEALQAIVSPVVQLAPRRDDAATTILQKSRQFLLQCTRADNKLDRYARRELLDAIDGMVSTLSLTAKADIDVWQWLEELPVERHILASGPKPGCIHVASLDHGGHSGRRHLFVIGLDDTRYPRRAAIDPILLDAERSRLSPLLLSSQDHARHQQQSLNRALCRVTTDAGASVHLSYTSRNLAEDRACFPSSSMLDIYRITSGNEDAHLDELLTHVGPAISFVSEKADGQLVTDDCKLAHLLLEQDAMQRRDFLEGEFKHMEHCRVAAEQRAAPQLCEYDGWVPQAGDDLDPTIAERSSASRLETFGTCPRRYFFKYGLGVWPPDECVVDGERWLGALQFGNLVHELFEDFLRGHTQSELLPNLSRDLGPLRDLLNNKIERLQSEIPIPNQDAFQRQRRLLESVCEIFLRKEQEYCETYKARPWILEASCGLDNEPRTELDCREPIELDLNDGRVIRMGGRIDRVDRLLVDGSERYAIWDYKSGSDFGFSQENPFQFGRKLQPFLYVGMLRHRIAAMGGARDSVASFGYFFPSPRTEGLKLQWTSGELKRGDEILRQICDLIKEGLFVSTTDPSDCKYCDYRTVCRSPEFVAAESLRKATEPCNQATLEPWIALRELDGVGESK